MYLKTLRERDTLIVGKLNHLGRDLRHLVNTVQELTTRGIGLKVLTFGIFAALAEFEQELIAERTRASLARHGRSSW